jgi:hypothetical protein
MPSSQRQIGPRMTNTLGSRASPCLRRHLGDQASTATGIRTRVSAMRGRRPSPLDDSGAETRPRLAKRAVAGPERRRACSRQKTRRARCACAMFAARRHADVAELVDAHGSGPCGGDSVEVRVLSSASTRPESRVLPARRHAPAPSADGSCSSRADIADSPCWCEARVRVDFGSIAASTTMIAHPASAAATQNAR